MNQKSVAQLGFWSAIVVTLMLIVFPLSLAFNWSLNIAYGSSFLLAPAFVTMMVSVHHYAAPEKKVWSQLGLSFAIIYAVMCSLTYYVQLTFVKSNYLPITEEAVKPFVFIPGTPIFAQDMLGYVFFCLATLAAGPAFTGGKLEAWIKWLFIFNGILFAIPTLILPTLTMPVNAAGTGVGNQVGDYANIVWSFYVAIATGLLANLFKRLKSTT
ncbi:MAG: hypothetical protein DYG85_15315 [Chloroflexi bacterium CFX1]|nr:hypothetical protein [Chloroflexi bacterium CFX1]MCQ3954254.1 hypothetical protein [Chloroflexota bacterium]MDL1920757.1 hypothetical protein [Chloroflexi bacterium CFX5]NUQ60312.1 hypothetical protein [Anaerolineales bacterium]